MFLRLHTLMRAGLILGILTGGTACKPRSGSSGLSDDNVGAGYSYENYHGPNMSDAACAANPDKCVCVLGNEYDSDEYRNAPVGSEKKKIWMRQCIGQEIWYKATAGGGRFHQYLAPQKLNFLSDWGWVLHTEGRRQRFDNWGIITDPDCCTPDSSPGAGDGNCPSGLGISQQDTYGWDYCPGDDVLLKYVGDPSRDYTETDPACNISRLEDKIGAGVRVGGGDDSSHKRFDSCHLAFGTSTGALGFRKFPNPRFDKEKWARVNDGSVTSWVNYSRRVPGSTKPDFSDKSGKQRLDDGSVEPPFIVAETCGSCHIGFDPTRPPKNPNAPEWKNILGAIGNTYLYMTQILGAGVPPGTVEHELFLHSRPGTVDTSAVTNDYVNNPGTMNAIINFDRRPGVIPGALQGQQGPTFHRFQENVTTYRQNTDGSWGEQHGKGRVPHVLKGGEDSIGAQGAVQRVYINIFSCTETCLGNHLDDLKVLSGRGSRQTPFELKQCQRDCPGYPAIEDRVWDIIDFLVFVRPSDLKNAKDPDGVEGGVDGARLVSEIKAKKAPGSDEAGSWYEGGKKVYADKCAKCHSSMPGQDARAGLVEGSSVRDIDVNKFMANVDKVDANGVRLDWLGSDVQVPSKLVDTYRCRSLHSNHMTGHLWENYASDDYKGPARYAGIDDSQFDFPIERLDKSTLGGRGFYRNISLLNAWAHAPFMHNNGLGPEWYHPLFDTDRGSPTDWKKLNKSPHVKTRLRMYEESMKQLLSPADERERTGAEKYKVVLTSSPVKLFSGASVPAVRDEFFKGNMSESELRTLKTQMGQIMIELPKGIPVSIISSVKHKQIMYDMMAEVAKQESYEKKLEAAQKFIQGLVGTGTNLDPDVIARNLMSRGYVNCGDKYDNRGHEFIDMSDTEKQQLIDFVKTL